MGLYQYDSTEDKLNLVAGSTYFSDAPVGAIFPFGGTDIPISFLLCDGSAVSRTDYEDLFNVIGTAFGTGDGSTTFNLPDLREAVPKGAGETGQTVGAHVKSGGLSVGEFLDDRIQSINLNVTSGAGGMGDRLSMGAGTVLNTPLASASTGFRYGATTEVKSVGVNYIIKAKQVGVPVDFLAEVGEVYQKKDLASAVEGATTVEGALGALSTNKQPKTLDTPLTINGVSRTTVENALSELNKAVNQRYGKNFSSAHDRYVKIGSIPISDTTSKRCQIDLLIFNNQLYGKVHLSLESRNNALAINGSSDIDLSLTDTVKPRIVASKDEINGVFNVYVDSSYLYLGIILYQYFPVSTFEFANFSDSASVDGTKVFDSSTDLTKIAYVKADVYSTSETKTNKVWIDGKPIYRKVVFWDSNLTSVTTTSNSTKAHGISNIDTIVKIEGKLYQPDRVGFAEAIPNYNASNDWIGRINVNTLSVSITYIGSWASYRPYVIIEYTKTTD